MKLGIYTNALKDERYIETESFIGLLNHYHIPYAVDKELANTFEQAEILDEVFSGVDILVVFGGDGTILSIAKKAAFYAIPILGINLGALGFLTEIEYHEYEKCILALIRGAYQIEHRAMLSTEFEGKVYHALNEITISRCNEVNTLSKVIRLSAYANDHLIDKFVADGVIVATPTGSTAYSLSCGGPILLPSLQAILITPISAHSLHSRPVILSDQEVITIKLSENYAKALIAIDGEVIAAVNGYCAVSIVKSRYESLFVRMSDQGFYQKLFTKLNKWSTTL